MYNAVSETMANNLSSDTQITHECYRWIVENALNDWRVDTLDDTNYRKKLSNKVTLVINQLKAVQEHLSNQPEPTPSDTLREKIMGYETPNRT